MKKLSYLFALLVSLTFVKASGGVGFTEADAEAVLLVGPKEEQLDSLSAVAGFVEGEATDITEGLELIDAVLGDTTTPLASNASQSGTAVGAGETRTLYEKVAALRGQMYRTFIEPAAGTLEVFDGALNEVAFAGVGLGLGAGLPGADIHAAVVGDIEAQTTARAEELGYASALLWHNAGAPEAAAHDAFITDLVGKAPGTTISAIMEAVRAALEASEDRATIAGAVGAPAGDDLLVYPITAAAVTTANGHVGAALRVSY